MSLKSYLDARREQIDQEELLAKVAAVETAWAQTPNKIERLPEAYEVIKQAMAEGSLPSDMSRSEQFSVAVDLIEESLADSYVKEAAAAEEPETGSEYGLLVDPDEELSKEAAEQVIGLGRALGARMAQDYGISLDDLSKLAEHEQEEFGRFLARLTASMLNEG